MSSGGYDPKAVENEIYAMWEAGGYFHAEPDPARKPFVITIPPPNVTGALHLGHALNNTLQDILIRRKRMQGYNACWLPGTDHAGIATQAVVEKRLREEQKLSRHEIGREGLVKKIWEWKEEYNTRILNQLRRMGCSCDWQRTRFTLDETCAKAVYETFFRFFKDGLIYRGLRLVNWDTQLQTAVADDEVYHETVRGHLWHIRYPVVKTCNGDVKTCKGDNVKTGSSGEAITFSRDHVFTPDEARAAIAAAASPDAKPGVDYLVVATTRPETMLADTAVAVHPDDERFKHLHNGQNARPTHYVMLPLMYRPIPVVADGMLVSKEFGTGCVKVTPGHDPNDFACYQRKVGQPDEIGIIDLLTPDGKINDAGRGSAFDYAGMKKEDARKKVVADLEALGLLEKVEPYETDIGHSDRSKTPIEPLRSEQWFVAMDKAGAPRLAEMAMEAVSDGRVKFFPERYAKSYLDWLGQKRDWCISRQLWWGHRIPVWRSTTESAVHDMDIGLTVFPMREWDRDGRIFTLWGGRCFDHTSIPLSFKGEAPGDGREAQFVICIRDPNDAEIIEALSEWGMEQDPDVLDTWFSSALWPHSTFGWPDTTGVVPTWSLRMSTEEHMAAEESAMLIGGALGFRCRVRRDNGEEFIVGGNEEGTYERWAEMVKSVPRDEPMTWYVELHSPSEFRMIEPAPGQENWTPPRTREVSAPEWLARLGFKQTTDLDYFYPTSVLSTAREIITLWVARMVMTGLYNVGRVPFQHVYIHAVIQDGHGRRMSKSAGNGVDPLDIIDAYGADALRFTLAQLATETQDIRIPVKPFQLPDGRTVNTSERFELGRNLVTKLWQAATGFVIPTCKDVRIEARPVEGVSSAPPNDSANSTGSGGKVWNRPMAGFSSAPSNTSGQSVGLGALGALHTSRPPADMPLFEKWIRVKLLACIREVDNRLDSYEFSAAVDAIRTFFWNDLCDWYIEEVKSHLRDAGASEEEKNDVKVTLLQVFDTVLCLFHPAIPFVTEAIWAEIGRAVPRHHELIWAADRETPNEAPKLIKMPWPSSGAGDHRPLAGSTLSNQAASSSKAATAVLETQSGKTQSEIEPTPSAALLASDAAWLAEVASQTDAEREVDSVLSVIRALREIRTSLNAIRSQAKQPALRTLPTAVVRCDAATAALLERGSAAIHRLGQVDAATFSADAAKPAQSLSKILTGIEVYVPIAGLADLDIERKRLTKERDELAGHLARLEGKLANEGFVAKAKPEVVEAERARLEELKAKQGAIERNLAELGG